MQRKQVLAFFGSFAPLSGCSGGPAESPAETTTMTGTNTSESESTKSGWTATITSDCGQTEFCEGPELVRVQVDGGLFGKVVLNPTCRKSDIELSSGETETLTQQTDVEICDIELLADGEVAYDGRTQDYEYVVVRVGSDEEVSLQKEVL